jgi:hypothetical protein
MVKKT